MVMFIVSAAFTRRRVSASAQPSRQDASAQAIAV
jgi:hypothetical protein